MFAAAVVFVVAAAALLVTGLAKDSQPLIWSSIVASALAAVFFGFNIALRQRRTAPAAAPAERPAAASRRVADQVDYTPARSAGGRPEPVEPSVEELAERVAQLETELQVARAVPGDGDSPESGPTTAETAERPAPEADDDYYAAADSDEDLVADEGRTDDAPDGLDSLDAPDQDDVPNNDDVPDEDDAPDQSDGSDPAPHPAYDDTDSEVDDTEEPAEEQASMNDSVLVVDLPVEIFVVDGRPRYHLFSCEFLDGREAIPLLVGEAREDGFTPCALCTPDATTAATERARLERAG